MNILQCGIEVELQEVEQYRRLPWDVGCSLTKRAHSEEGVRYRFCLLKAKPFPTVC